MRHALTVPDWLSVKHPELGIKTMEQLKARYTSGECIVCGKAAKRGWALCRGHKGAFHRWQRRVEKERTHAFIVVITETNVMMDARANGFTPKYHDLICDALGDYSASLRSEWGVTALLPFTIEVTGE